MTKKDQIFGNKYGCFSSDGREFIIFRPDTPTPWVNVICNGDHGLVISQTGSGFSWRGNSALARINTWHQDLIRDDYGKYIYLRDDQTGNFWSLGWKPCRPKFKKYEVVHGIGYTRITSQNKDIESAMLVFVPPDEPLEIWKVSLKNLSERPREISLFTYLEWCLGNGMETHREFHRTFIETEYHEDLHSIYGKKRPLPVPGYISTGKPEVALQAFHSVNVKPSGYEGSKLGFLGVYGSLEAPAAVKNGALSNEVGKVHDDIASLHVKLKLKPNEERSLVFTLGGCFDDNGEHLIKKYRSVNEANKAFQKTVAFWDDTISGVMVETPDPAFDLMTNYWLKYQAISAHMWARTGYYQCSGGYGFRDQLQSSLLTLPLKPELTRDQILLHAKHQFKDGSVYHWWHPLTEMGARTNISDNMLWLPYVTLSYLAETGDYSILREKVPYVDGGEASLYEHCVKAIKLALSRLSSRGLPLIGSGDWNDGLSAVGIKWRGESVWLGHFLYGILKDFAEVCRRMRDGKKASHMKRQAEKLKKAINRWGWDGSWYWRASRDDGKLIGSSSCREGKIYLNAQTWSVINETAPPDRAKKAMESVERYLMRDFGPLLLHPAYTHPDESIGYITRYAPGMRENGGVYTHAAVWAILAYCKLRRGDKAFDVYSRMSPPKRGLDADTYQGEPYALPGNTDGPQSPLFGRGSWTWYSGSAAWLFKVSTEWILGIRPTEKGLLIDPCIPKKWGELKILRRYRKTKYEIEIKNPKHVECGVKKVTLDGKPLREPYLPDLRDGKIHHVRVEMG